MAYKTRLSRCAVLALAVASLYIPAWFYSGYRRNVRTMEAFERAGKMYARLIDEEIAIRKMLREP